MADGAQPVHITGVIFDYGRVLAWTQHQEPRAAWERRLGPWTLMTVEYSYLRGFHLFRLQDVNAPLPGTGLRPNPSLRNVLEIGSAGMMRDAEQITPERACSPLHDVPPRGESRIAGEDDLPLTSFEDEHGAGEVRITVVDRSQVGRAVGRDE